jgi:hypothetical protein
LLLLLLSEYTLSSDPPPLPSCMMTGLAQAPAVLDAFYPGELGGPAIVDALFGDVVPSGKLPVTVYVRRGLVLPSTTRTVSDS